MEWIAKLAIYALPVMFAITVHEAAHAYAAKAFGDKTAYDLGRATINPIPHIDILGTVVLPALCLVTGGFLFGWAKPVPIDPTRMRYPKSGFMWTALAGPGANLLMAVLWAFAMLFAQQNIFGAWFSVPLHLMAKVGIEINLVLMAFNLLPLPPLDGARVIQRFLSRSANEQYSRLEPYGLFIVLALSFTSILGTFWIYPIMRAFDFIWAIPRLL